MEINSFLYFWPEEYSKLNKSDKWIAYINATGCINIEQNILSAQSNNSNVIVLYSYPQKKEQCIPRSDEFLLPVFVNTDERCKNFSSNSNSSNLNTFIKHITTQSTGEYNSNNSNNDNVIETYQTAMIVLYVISGAVLGIFIIIVFTNLVKRRLQSRQPIHPIGGNNQQNRGITKAVLDSFPVYSFSLKKNVNEDIEKGHDKVTYELETLKTVDDEKGNLTVDEINQVEKTHDISIENKEIKDKNIATTDENIMNNLSQNGQKVISQNSLNNDNLTLFNNKVTEVQSTCPICLGDFESGEEVRILPCGHQYHTACIDTWLLEISSLCPMCKADYTSWNIDLSNSLHGDISASTDSSGIFPHFRWIKYLTSIRSRRRSRRRRTRINAGEGKLGKLKMAKDIIDECIDDQTIILKLKERFENTNDERERQKIHNTIIREMSIHFYCKEVNLYPLLEKHLPDGKSVCEKCRQTNKEIKKELAKLDVDEAQGKVFPRFKEAIAADVIKEAGAKYASSRSLAPTHPHPDAPNEVKSAVATAPVDKARDIPREFVDTGR
ncbi:10066_t:CDS:2 [Diversispora eburnea]|uniref:10066_t:CDS:1 n=1 Tax=Diversispora eburnea TaxID=1213867 RepID=A0A9N8W5U9_9GLOM|nr:10066_t:CDS:2 [Diversispora eburnea]